MTDQKKAAAKRHGLVLSLGGAAEVPHQIPGLDGEFHPSEARDLKDCTIAGDFYEIEDEDGSKREGFRAEGASRPLTLEEAKKLDSLEGFPLRLVELD